MPLPAEADQVVLMGYLLDEITGGGLAGEVKSEPIALPGQAPVPMVLDAVSHAHIQTRPRVTTPDPTTGFWALMALATNDPDLEAYGGRRVTLPGQAPRDIEVPWNAATMTVRTAMAAQVNPGNVAGKPQVGDTVRAIWFHSAAGFVAPTPTNAYLTSAQTIDLIAQAIGQGGGGSGGGDLPEYSSAAQTAAVTASGLLSKTTRFNTTSAAIAQPLPPANPGAVVAVGWDAGTNALTLTAAGSDVIGSGSATSVPVPVVNAVLQLHCTTAGRWRVVGGHLPSSYVVFNSANTDVSGAAAGKVVAAAQSGYAVMDYFRILAKDPDNLVETGTITRDANGAALTAPVVWPDGTTGVYTATTVSTAFPGAVDAYTITYDPAGTANDKTFTQPAVTRDANGAVTARPALVVS